MLAVVSMTHTDTVTARVTCGLALIPEVVCVTAHTEHRTQDDKDGAAFRHRGDHTASCRIS
jgi:hypothetical protein